MKKILTLLLLVFPIFAIAQEKVSFKLTPQANFVTTSGEDFVIVPFEGKSAHEIYQILTSNVVSVYTDASEVMNGVNDELIKIRGFFPVYIKKVLGVSQPWGGYYQLEFRIKDGRVRVSAPFVEDDISFGLYGTDSFSQVVKKWYKNGEVKKKEAKHVELIEIQMNGTINAILGLLSAPTKVDDDW